jgi:hypothetical protein
MDRSSCNRKGRGNGYGIQQGRLYFYDFAFIFQIFSLYQQIDLSFCDIAEFGDRVQLANGKAFYSFHQFAETIYFLPKIFCDDGFWNVLEDIIERDNVPTIDHGFDKVVPVISH